MSKKQTCEKPKNRWFGSKSLTISKVTSLQRLLSLSDAMTGFPKVTKNVNWIQI